MTLELSTPTGAVVALAVVVPLAAFLGVSRRAARLRQALRLADPPLRTRLVPVAAVLTVAGLLGLAAAQPLLRSTSTHRVRSDAEVFVLVDISRSMLARRGPDAPMRIERAKAAAARLRASLPGVPVGLASLTNRVLPHLFPSGNEDVFDATLEDAIDVNRPPPGSSFLSPAARGTRNATSLGSLEALATQRFYSPGAKHRLLVVLTDGESLDVSPAQVGRRLRRAAIRTIFVQFWGANDEVFRGRIPEPQYRANPQARSILETMAAATGGRLYDERNVEAAARDARQALGTGPTIVADDQRSRPLALAPYVAGAAFLPLAFLLWRRNR